MHRVAATDEGRTPDAMEMPGLERLIASITTRVMSIV